ncbi:diacylglycerol kinase catalytic domain-containing protein [Besnoitia besnoiti]|uniref:Diacylglycerol kinase n=1 Tax=Besnoitia besnoiti TaxID=94643 RepID=A0A2A9MHF4_BESBE|nr:diacylglycerol kinase catalytic domain-containing protein [Besnoitia besnoiti]PFH37968.1 diacylglycerol kinase catalytic domain-containing protein [Besnoitia besnoiti]
MDDSRANPGRPASPSPLSRALSLSSLSVLLFLVSFSSSTSFSALPPPRVSVSSVDSAPAVSAAQRLLLNASASVSPSFAPSVFLFAAAAKAKPDASDRAGRRPPLALRRGGGESFGAKLPPLSAAAALTDAEQSTLASLGDFGSDDGGGDDAEEGHELEGRVNDGGSSEAGEEADARVGVAELVNAVAEDYEAHAEPAVSHASLPAAPRLRRAGEAAETLRADAKAVAASWPCKAGTRFVFLFVNGTSGGGSGANWLREADANGRYARDFADICSRVLIYDLGKSCKDGFLVLKQVVETKRTLTGTPMPKKTSALVRVIAVGGDGTVMWVNQEALNAQVPLEWMAIGTVGFGTGNDFAQSYGWTGRHLTKADIYKGDTLKTLVTEWQKASVTLHDMWKVNITTAEGGYFERIDRKTRQMVKVLDETTGEPARHFESLLNLYLGFGFESMVGLEFDRLRSTSRFRNRIMYGVAFLKFLNRPWTKISHQVESVYAIENGEKRILFTTNPTKYPDALQLEDCISLTLLNNRSIIGGVALWRRTQKVGVLPPASDTPANRAAYENMKDRLVKANQSMGDGKIELLSFHDRFALMRSVLVDHNAARRLAQHRGPFSVTFYAPEKAGSVGFQVDGEFRQATRVESATVEYIRSFNVLNNEAAAPRK